MNRFLLCQLKFPFLLTILSIICFETMKLVIYYLNIYYMYIYLLIAVQTLIEKFIILSFIFLHFRFLNLVKRKYHWFTSFCCVWFSLYQLKIMYEIVIYSKEQ